MCMNTSPKVLKKFRLLRFIGIDIFFFKQIALHHGVTHGDNLEIQNERHHGTGNLKKFRDVTREVESSTPAGTTLRVLK